MAQEHRNEPITYGQMDYSEHDKTYGRFLWLVKNGTIAVIAILLGMLAYLIAGWGPLGGLAAFLGSGALLYIFMK